MTCGVGFREAGGREREREKVMERRKSKEQTSKPNQPHNRHLVGGIKKPPPAVDYFIELGDLCCFGAEMGGP